MTRMLHRNQKVQPQRGRRHGGRPAYAGKWSDEDDIADHLSDLPPWQALQVCSVLSLSPGHPMACLPMLRRSAPSYDTPNSPSSSLVSPQIAGLMRAVLMHICVPPSASTPASWHISFCASPERVQAGAERLGWCASGWWTGRCVAASQSRRVRRGSPVGGRPPGGPRHPGRWQGPQKQRRDHTT